MKITHKTSNNIAVVALQGRFDSTSVPKFKKAMEIESLPADCVIEMEEVNYIDSGGLGCLVALLRRAQKRNGSVKISRIPQKIHYAFELTRLNRIFDMYDDTEVALSSFRTDH